MNMFNDYIKLPTSDEEWKDELKGFIENYEFRCAGAWDGFHVYISSKSKKFYNFKHIYSVSSIALFNYDKQILDLIVGAPGSTHDARFLRDTGLYKKVISGSGLANKTVEIDTSYGEIRLVTIGDSALPRFPRLIKSFKSNTDNLKERLYNLKLSSTRLVNENAYGILNSRWRKLYKKTEMKIFNLKYTSMACAMLHNLCIVRNDSCNPRWRLTVDKLELNCNNFSRQQSNNESNKNDTKIADWLWQTGSFRIINVNFIKNIFVVFNSYMRSLV